MKKLIATTAIVVVSSLSTPASAQGFNPALLAWMFEPIMPAAVYFDGTSKIIAPVPLQSWPWETDAASLGTLSVWVEPDYPKSQLTWAPFETAFTHNPPLGLEFQSMLLEFFDTGGLYLDSAQGYFSSQPIRCYYNQAPPNCAGFLAGTYRSGSNPQPLPLIHSLWQRIHMTWDVRTRVERFELYIDDQPVPIENWSNIADYPSFAVNTNAINAINFFVRSFSDVYYQGGVSEFWLTFGSTLWPSLEANRRLFETLDHHQVFIGKRGELPLGGAEPAFYFGDYAIGTNTWGCNSTGGPHTLTVGPQPPRIPGPNATIQIGPGGWVPTWADLAVWPRVNGPSGKC